MNEEKNWIIEDDKVKVGNSYKTLKDLKLEFGFEIGLSVLMVVVSVFMVSINFIFTLICLIVAIVMALVAIGSYSAYNALFLKISKTKRNIVKKKEKHQEENKENVLTNLKNLFNKKENSKKTLTVINTKLVKSTAKVRQEKISEMNNEDIIELIGSDVLFSEDVIGELSAKVIKKLEEYEGYEKQIKLLSIEKNENDKYSVSVEITVLG